MGYCSVRPGCQCSTHNGPCVCRGSQNPVNTLSPALITPLSAPNQANTSGEFKPLTSQTFLCNNRLSFWRSDSTHGGRPSGRRGFGEARRGEGLPRAGGRSVPRPGPGACHLSQAGHSWHAPALA